MNASSEAFFARWSRLKRVGNDATANPPAVAAPAATAEAPAVPKSPLPDPERLNFDDDFAAFLGREVEEQVKRAAMKKLFHSPHFNVMDGLDIYIDDYTIPSPLDEATLRSLMHATDLLFDGKPEVVAAAAEADSLLSRTPDEKSPGIAPTEVPAAPVKDGVLHDA